MLDGISHSELVKFLTRIVGRDAADDVAQITYLRILTAKAPYEGRSSKQTWAFAIARRCAYTWLAKQKREPEQIGSPAVAVDDAGRTERRMLLVGGLARLSSMYQDVLQAHLKHGNHEDVARELGISVPAAKMRYARAKEALKDVLTRTRRD